MHAPQLVLVLSDEALHVWLPAVHDPSLPVSQLCALPAGQTQLASFLSGVPLQLLSALDVQSLALAAISPVHVVLHVAPVHDCTPDLQIPAVTPQLRVVPLTQPQPSLGTPLQLASLPASQPSLVAGPTSPAQAPHEVRLSAPRTQVCDPAVQGK